jgi:hypothetical protein
LLTRTYADVVEAQEAVVDAVVAELGADVADRDARQRLVGRQRPDLHDEAVRPIVLHAAPTRLTHSTKGRRGGPAQRQDDPAHGSSAMWLLASAWLLTLPLMNRRAMHTTCVAVLPKPAHHICHRPLFYCTSSSLQDSSGHSAQVMQPLTAGPPLGAAERWRVDHELLRVDIICGCRLQAPHEGPMPQLRLSVCANHLQSQGPSLDPGTRRQQVNTLHAGASLARC